MFGFLSLSLPLSLAPFLSFPALPQLILELISGNKAAVKKTMYPRTILEEPVVVRLPEYEGLFSVHVSLWIHRRLHSPRECTHIRIIARVWHSDDVRGVAMGNCRQILCHVYSCLSHWLVVFYWKTTPAAHIRHLWTTKRGAAVIWP